MSLNYTKQIKQTIKKGPSKRSEPSMNHSPFGYPLMDGSLRDIELKKQLQTIPDFSLPRLTGHLKRIEQVESQARLTLGNSLTKKNLTLLVGLGEEPTPGITCLLPA